MDCKEAIVKMKEEIELVKKAFPDQGQCMEVDGTWGQGWSPGMMRDWFAGMANEEDIAEFLPQTMGDAKKFADENGFWPTRQWARYRHADAMLEAQKIR